MSKVLILLPATTEAFDQAYAAAQLHFVRMTVDQLGIPYDVLQADLVTSDDYLGAIIPHSLYNTYASIKPWVRGDKTYPVLALRTTLGHSLTDFPSGATVSGTRERPNFSDQPSAITSVFTHAEGFTICVPDFYRATMYNTTDGGWNTEPMLTDGDGKMVVWKRIPPAAKPCPWVMYATTNGDCQIELYQFLRDIGAVASKPTRIYLSINNISGSREADTGWGEGRRLLGYDAGLTAIMAWARSKGAYIAGGLNNVDIAHWSDGTYDNDSAIADILLNNPDVFGFYIQDGTANRNYWNVDIGDFATVDGKLAAYDASIAEWAALGFDVSRSGMEGYIYPPAYPVTRLSRKAMAMAGVKFLPNYYHGYYEGHSASRAGWHEEVFPDPEPYEGSMGEISHYRLRTSFDFENITITMPVASWQYSSYRPDNKTTLQGAYYYNQYRLSFYALAYCRRVFNAQPWMLCTDAENSAEDQSLLKILTNMVDPWINLCGPNIVRYATKEDWEKLGKEG
jgi:hypothetical protein